MPTFFAQPAPALPDPCSLPGGGTVCGAIGAVAGLPGKAAGSLATSAFDGMVQALKEGVGTAVGLMMSFWMKIPIPALGSQGGAVTTIHDATLYLTVITGVVSLFFVAAKAAMAHSSASSEETQNAARGLIRLVVASTVAVPAVILANSGVDEYSRWLVDQAAGGDVGAAVGKLMSFDAITGSGFTFILAVFALVASIVQAFLIVIRDALLIVLVGTLPLAAAASITGSGRETWNKAIGWLISFTLFKLAAGIIYATALYSVSNATDVMGQVAGIFLIILAVFTLPALMRLISPQVAKVGGGGGGGGMLAAAGTMATGAATLATTRGAGAGGGGGSRNAPGQASFKGEPGASGASPTPGGGAGGGQRPGGGAGGAGAVAGKNAAGAGATSGVGAGVAVLEKAHGAITTAASASADGEGSPTPKPGSGS